MTDREMALAAEDIPAVPDEWRKDIGKLPPVEVMRECIFKIWHTEETLGLFDYLDSQRKKNRPLALAGFDRMSNPAT